MATLTHKDMERLTSELASLVRTGIPVPEGLRRLSDDLTIGPLKTLTAEVAAATERGEQVSEALAKSAVTVPPEFLALMRCAETSGDSTSLLEFAVEHGRRIRRHRDAISTAIYYPSILLIGLICVAQFHAHTSGSFNDGIMGGLGARYDMSFSTQASLTISELLRSAPGILVSIVGIGLLMLPLISYSIRERLLSKIEHMPLVEGLVVASDTALWSKFIATMLGKGVPAPLAFEAASLAVSGSTTRRALAGMAKAAERGLPLADALPVRIPMVAAYIFRQGEDRGTLAVACDGISDYCEDRFEVLARRASALLEPLLLTIVGIVIVVFLAMTYAPLFDLPKHIGR